MVLISSLHFVYNMLYGLDSSYKDDVEAYSIIKKCRNKRTENQTIKGITRGKDLGKSLRQVLI